MRLINADKIINFQCRGEIQLGDGHVGERDFVVLPIKSISDIPTVTKDFMADWIPITTRLATQEEREENGWSEDITHTFTCPLPDDGDEVLISRSNGKWVDLVEFCNDDYGVGDEDGNDWLYEVEAWMPVPKGYININKE